MKKNIPKTLPYTIGFILSSAGFLLGSNVIFPRFFEFASEYKMYVAWSISGLFMSCVGNILGILIVYPRNIIKTIIGAIIGLGIGVMLSFVPYLFWVGISTIFIGSMIGHYSEGKVSNKHNKYKD